MPYVLSVTTSDGAGGTDEYIYTSDEDAGGGAGLLDVTFSVGAEATGGEVRTREITLSVAAPFVGATERGELPDPLVPGIRRGRGFYRAQLTRAGEVVANGLIPLDSIEHEPILETFTFQLTGAASNDLWTRLGDWSFADLTESQYDALTKVEMPYAYGERVQFGIYSSLRYFYSDYVGSPVPATMPVFLLVWLLRDAAEYASAASGLGDITVVSMPQMAFSVRYVDSAMAPQTIIRPSNPYVYGFGMYRGGTFTYTNTTLPAWTAKQLWDNALAAFGWRLVAEYDSYPSLDINLRVLGDTIPADTSQFPDLTDRLAESGYTRAAEPGSTGGFGVRHGGEARPVAPLPTYLKGRTAAITAGHGVVAVPPPAVANLALDEWTFDKAAPNVRRVDDPEPTAEAISDTGFLLPMIAPPEAEGLALGEEDRTPDGVDHPDYDEKVVWGVPLITPNEEDAGYLCAVELDDDGDPRILHARRVLSVLQEGQWGLVNEVWAREMYQLRGMSVAPLEVASGEFYVQALDYTVGDPSRGVTLEDEPWEIRDEERGLSDDLATLTMVRPTAEAAPDPVLAPTPGPVSDFRAQHWRVFAVPAGTLESAYTVLSWTPSPLSQPAAWYALTVEEIGGATNNYVVYGTSVILSDGFAPTDEEFIATINAVGDTATAGPSVTITFQTDANAAVNP